MKQFLYTEKYTIQGAKQRLEQLRRGGELHEAAGNALDRGMVELLRSELAEVLELLQPVGHTDAT